jgi:mannose-6-phosphate isomerase-like protein (cupin superfamily)
VAPDSDRSPIASAREARRTTPHSDRRVSAAVLHCDALGPSREFFEALGFSVRGVLPADDPRVIELYGHGIWIALVRGEGPPGWIRVATDARSPGRTQAPNGAVVEFVHATVELDLPPPPEDPQIQVERAAGDARWVTGRAGMQYRDLIPGRVGGRYVASHIRIPEGGPVPDYVHYHHVRFQLIFCRKGWVRVVYEDQGPPFVLEAGDGVLQPPGIRHRVLEASPGLEVVEIGTPANHETRVDPELELPTRIFAPQRRFSRQRFVRFSSTTADSMPWDAWSWRSVDSGISAATGGLASVRVASVRERAATVTSIITEHDLSFGFMLEGRARLQTHRREGGIDSVELGPDDAWTLPAGTAFALIPGSDDARFLDVRVGPVERSP